MPSYRPSRNSLVTLALTSFVAFTLGACAPAPPLTIAAPEPAPARARRSPLAELPSTGLVLVVYKGARTLAVYRDGRFDRRYAVVFGKQPNGRKRYQGDMRTPEGLYRVKSKAHHPRWRQFIAIDYPNSSDIEEYKREIARGRVPAISGENLDIGSGLGIHGNDRPVEQINGDNWTKGCVAMRNDDVDELASLVPVGTPILFLP